MRTYFQFILSGNVSKKALEDEIEKMGLSKRIKKDNLFADVDVNDNTVVLFRLFTGSFTSDSLFDLITEFGELKKLLKDEYKEWAVSIECKADCYEMDSYWFSIDSVFANFIIELNSGFSLCSHRDT